MDRFNDTTKNDEGYEFKKYSYPYTKKKLKFFEEEENMNNDNNENNENNENNDNNDNNENVNENDNLSCNFSEICEQNNNNNNNHKNQINNDKIIFVSELIPEITKIYQKAKKFDYNFDIINSDFKDFIHNISFENDENKNISNIPYNTSNNVFNNNYTKEKLINETFSNMNISPKNVNSIENNNTYLGKYIILENGKKQINKDLIKCNCKNSYCLKFYCECFSNGKYCENCFCCNCKNKKEYENLRQDKYKNILSRNPKAIYQINSTKKSWTCNCKNSNCMKKYCDCFQFGKSCTSKCKCVNCLNKVSNINNNNFGKNQKVRRIRGVKKLIKNNIYLTPKKKPNSKKDGYNRNYIYNQSTADLTENNKKNNIFNGLSNNISSKPINIKLNMNEV